MRVQHKEALSLDRCTRVRGQNMADAHSVPHVASILSIYLFLYVFIRSILPGLHTCALPCVLISIHLPTLTRR